MERSPSPPAPNLSDLLHQQLAGIPCLSQARCCALLNHPAHGNLGDLLIWTGQLHYLEHVRRIQVRYVASPDHYAAVHLRRAIGDQPIVLSGGGQLGDTWPQLLAFILRVVRGHPGNPLVIFPQSLHFRDQGRLRSASETLQAHPDLTLVLRDRPSFQLAERHFSGCRLILAPSYACWTRIGFAAATVAVAHLLTRRFTRVLFASGGHPLLGDIESLEVPHFSSSALDVVIDQAGISREEKLQRLARWPSWMERIQPCHLVTIPGAGHLNCGRCEKCMRTMLSLHSLGLPISSITFQEATLDPLALCR